MTRFEYIDALRQALSGLPPDVIAATVAEYERRIAAASDAGQSEDEIIASLGDPQVVAEQAAAQRRTVPAVDAVKQEKTAVNVVRMFFSLIGLMVFNLFLVIPALFYSALLFVSFVVALALYGGGIALTTASLSNINDPSPNRTVQTAVSKSAASTAVASANASAPIASPPAVDAVRHGDDETYVKVGPNGVRVSDGSNKIRIFDDDDDNFDVMDNKHGVSIDLPGLRIRNAEHGDNFVIGALGLSETRPVQASIGIGLILAGILSFLMCLVVAKYTLIGILRLAQMEFSVLKNA